MADITVAARVPPEVKAELTKRANEHGKKLGPYLTDLLTKHVSRAGEGGGEPKRPRPEPAPPAVDREALLQLTEAMRVLGTSVEEFHQADAHERDDFYRALLAVFSGQFLALESTKFTEAKADEFLDRVFRKPLLGGD